MSLLTGACHRESAPSEEEASTRSVEDSSGTAEFSNDGARVNCNIRKSIAKLTLAARKVRMEYGSRLATKGNLLGNEKSMVFLGVRRKSVRDKVVKMVEREGILTKTNC